MTEPTPRTARSIEQLEQRGAVPVDVTDSEAAHAVSVARYSAARAWQQGREGVAFGEHDAFCDGWDAARAAPRGEVQPTADVAAVQRFLAFLFDHDCAVVHLDDIGTERYRKAVSQHQSTVEHWADEEDARHDCGQCLHPRAEHYGGEHGACMDVDADRDECTCKWFEAVGPVPLCRDQHEHVVEVRTASQAEAERFTAQLTCHQPRGHDGHHSTRSGETW